MATPMTLNQCINQCKKWGIPYEVYSGAVGRPGTFTPIGFILHHTGGPFTESDSYLAFLFKVGRPADGIPAQLCHFSGGPSGKIYLGKVNQRANHAGAGWWRTRQLVGAENYNGYNDEIDPGRDDYLTGNSLYYGLEVNYPGTVPMKDVQWNSAVKLAAAIMDFHGWTALSCIGHREHSYRKWDPGSHTLWQFRRDVRDLLIRGPGGTPPPTKDWFDMATEADLKRVVDASINALVPGIVDKRLDSTDSRIESNHSTTDSLIVSKHTELVGALGGGFAQVLSEISAVLNLTEAQTKFIEDRFIKYLAESARWEDLIEWDGLPLWKLLSTPKLDTIIDMLEPVTPAPVNP